MFTSRLFQGIKNTLRLSLLACALVFIALPSALPPPAHAAAAVCGEHDQLEEKLAEEFGEQVVALGLSSKGSVVEVFVAGDGVTWTIVLTSPDGKSCIVADGEAWIELTPKVLGPEAFYRP